MNKITINLEATLKMWLYAQIISKSVLRVKLQVDFEGNQEKEAIQALLVYEIKMIYLVSSFLGFLFLPSSYNTGAVLQAREGTGSEF